MDTAKILLPEDLMAAIGTKNLNSCSALAILGQAGIILVHVALLPPHPLGASSQRPIVLGEGEAHFISILNKIRALYNEHKSRFPARSTSWAIFGIFEGSVAMPEKLEIAKRYFSSLGLPTKCAEHRIARALSRTNPATGTVLGLTHGGKVYIYVEDQVKDCIDFTQHANSASSASSSVGASSSAGGPSTAPIAQAQGIWMFSNATQTFFYRTREFQPVPQAQWPQLAGSQQVFIWETREIKTYDFTAKQWQRG